MLIWNILTYLCAVQHLMIHLLSRSSFSLLRMDQVVIPVLQYRSVAAIGPFLRIV